LYHCHHYNKTAAEKSTAVRKTMVCAAGEGYDSSNATAIMPTRFRHNGETTVFNALW
jgi:hypothetical protein